MALALGRSLVRRRGFDAQDVCEEFAAWLDGGPLDVGNTCRRGIRRYIVDGTIDGRVFARATRAMAPPCASLPVALAALGRPDAATNGRSGQCRITHHHPLSDAASLALVRMVQALISGEGERGPAAWPRRWSATQPVFAFDALSRPVVRFHRRHDADGVARLF